MSNDTLATPGGISDPALITLVFCYPFHPHYLQQHD